MSDADLDADALEQRAEAVAAGRGRATLADLRKLCKELLRAERIARRTSDGYRDTHAAWQRWAAVHAPDAIGDEQKRDAIDGMLRSRLAVYSAACALVDREGPLVEADRTRDPLCVAVDAARGMTAAEAIAERNRRADAGEAVTR